MARLQSFNQYLIQNNNMLKQISVTRNHCNNYLNHKEDCSTISSPTYNVEGDKSISFNNALNNIRELYDCLFLASPLSLAGKTIVIVTN